MYALGLCFYEEILGQCMQKGYVFMKRFWDSVCTRIMFYEEILGQCVHQDDIAMWEKVLS